MAEAREAIGGATLVELPAAVMGGADRGAAKAVAAIVTAVSAAVTGQLSGEAGIKTAAAMIIMVSAAMAGQFSDVAGVKEAAAMITAGSAEVTVRSPEVAGAKAAIMVTAISAGCSVAIVGDSVGQGGVAHDNGGGNHGGTRLQSTLAVRQDRKQTIPASVARKIPRRHLSSLFCLRTDSIKGESITEKSGSKKTSSNNDQQAIIENLPRITTPSIDRN